MLFELKPVIFDRLIGRKKLTSFILIMPAVEELSSHVLKETITYAVKKVFLTMLECEAVLKESETDPNVPDVPPPALSGPQVVGTVGFVGEMNGLIYLHFPEHFAHSIAGALLGMSHAELDECGNEVVNDAIGEITNMTVGAFKNRLSEHGFPCRLTIPSILLGSNFHIEPLDFSVRQTFRFSVGGEDMIADLLLKDGE